MSLKTNQEVFPGGQVLRLQLPLQGARVIYLIGKLKSPTSHATQPKNKVKYFLKSFKKKSKCEVVMSTNGILRNLPQLEICNI